MQITISDITEFVSYLHVELAYSKATSYCYKLDLLQYRKFSEVLSVEQVKGYLRSLSLQATSLNRKLACLKHFIKFQLTIKPHLAPGVSGILQLTNLKQTSRIIKTISLEAQTALFSLAKSNLQMYLIIELLYSTGMRVSECLSLKVKDMVPYNPEYYALKLRGKSQQERLVPIHLPLYEMIKQEMGCKLRDDYMFTNKRNPDKPLTRQWVFKYLKKLALEANLDIKSISPHKFRHTIASTLVENGASIVAVKQLLGHKNLASTMFYTKIGSQTLYDVLLKHRNLE